MITELTAEQEAKFPEYVERWTAIGLDTAPLDFEAAKTAVSNYYEALNLDKPKRFFKWASPYQAALGIAIFNTLQEEVENPQEFIQGLDAETKALVTDSSKLQEAFNEMVYGCHDAHWVAFYKFVQKELKVEGLDIVNELEEVTKQCGWWSAYREAVVLQEKPQYIKFDDEKRLHCEDGPSIRYSDGYSVYSWHGTQVPAEWIEDTENSLTAKTALTWDNVEQRRCACEILGWINVLESLDYRVLNSNPNPEIGSLVEVDIPEIGTEKFLMVKCGTGRNFALPVPPEMKTSLESQAWLNFCSEEDILNLEVRT